MNGEPTARQMTTLRIVAARRPTPLTVQQLFEFGQSGRDHHHNLLVAARFIHTEIPIRIARMAIELEHLGGGLAEMPSVLKTRLRYVESFFDVFDHPPLKTPEDEKSFARLLARIKDRHINVAASIGRGMRELKERTGRNDPLFELQEDLDRFYLARIGIRMIVGQYLALHEERGEGWTGIVCSRTCPAGIAEEAGAKASEMCRMGFGVAPPLEVLGNRSLQFTYIPSHLHHMLLELLKNSMRATAMFHHDEKRLPPVRVVIADGEEDISIKISDKGGGIPRSGMRSIWTYFYTTATHSDDDNPYHTDADPLAGYGVGLPMTRLYARYFGGDVQLMSLQGYGTDAYLHINRLGTQEEMLTRDPSLGMRTTGMSGEVPKLTESPSPVERITAKHGEDLDEAKDSA
jgi:pyruvate dehydrogenase kinase 2/3/4